MRLVWTLGLSVLAALGFGAAVYWVLRPAQEAIGPELAASYLSGNFCTDTSTDGKWMRLELRPEGTCSRWLCWSEGQRQVFGPEQSGRWRATEAGGLELRWNDGLVEAVHVAITEEGSCELRVQGERYRELVPLDCY